MRLLLPPPRGVGVKLPAVMPPLLLCATLFEAGVNSPGLAAFAATDRAEKRSALVMSSVAPAAAAASRSFARARPPSEAAARRSAEATFWI